MTPGTMLRTRLLRALTARGPLPRGSRLAAPAPRGRVAISGGIPVGMRLLARHVPPTHPQAHGLVRGTVEPAVQEALRRTLHPGAVMWDVGANVGFMCLVACRLGARAVAVEPVPANARAVREHAAINGLDIQVVEAAAGEAAGRADFLLVDDPSWSHLADRGRHALTDRVVGMEVIRLDDAGLPAPQLVKIDVEGSEVAVLRGMERTLREHAPTVVCELHSTNAEMADLLEPLGYRLENLSGPEPVREAGAVHVLATSR